MSTLEVNNEYRRLSQLQDTPEADIRRVLSPDTLAAAAALLRTRCGTEPVLLATHDREAIRLLGWPVIELEAL